MPKKDLKHYYKRARKEGWALPQLNFSSAEQLKGIVRAGEKLRSPLFVGTSEGDAGFLGMGQAAAMVARYRKEIGLPIFLNLDHGRSFEAIKEAVEAGYDAVHFDGSGLPFQENAAMTRKIVQYARKRGVQVVEGEYEEVPGEHSTFHKGRAKVKAGAATDPEEARRFAAETGVDSLAVLIGTVHGVYEENPRLDLDRLQKIAKRVQSFLVLHGGSGTPRKDLLGAVKLGIVKVNVSTELRSAFSEALRKSLKERPEEITPYKIFPPAVRAVQKAAEERIAFLGAKNKV